MKKISVFLRAAALSVATMQSGGAFANGGGAAHNGTRIDTVGAFR